MPRMVYSGDVHGSEVVWFKFLKAAEEYKADIIFMNGDLTGKKIVPISKMSDTWKTPNIFGKEWILRTKDEVQDITKRIRHIGMYPWIAPYEKVMEYAKDPTKWDDLFVEVMQKEMDRWLLAAEEKVSKDVTIIVAPGNDDPFFIDEIIAKHEEWIVYPNDKVVWLDEKHPMITCAWSNPTPWDSPREEPERELEKRLLRKFKMVNESFYSDMICAFHVPPFDSGIDMAPKLDKNLKPVLIGGHPVMIPVGSKSVRKVIERYEPLIGLHSHIHESPGEVKLGRTICINPGSEYDRGILRMYVFDLGPEGIEKYWRITG